MGTCALNQSFDAEALYRGYCKKGSNIWEWVENIRVPVFRFVFVRRFCIAAVEIKIKSVGLTASVSPSASYLEKHPK